MLSSSDQSKASYRNADYVGLIAALCWDTRELNVSEGFETNCCQKSRARLRVHIRIMYHRCRNGVCSYKKLSFVNKYEFICN